MVDYYRDGYREAVLFLFMKDGKILVEHRPKGAGKETFIPNGGVDTADVAAGGDYLLNAMFREVREEFSGHVAILTHAPIGTFLVEELRIRFHGYLVTSWQGDVPPYTVEEGKRYADLEWIPVEKHKDHLTLPSALFFVREALKGR